MHPFLVSVLLFPSFAGSAPQVSTAEIAKIDAMVKSLKPLMKGKARYFAELGEDIGMSGPWKEFSSDKTREKAWDKYYLNEKADVFFKSGIPVIVKMMYPSEDSGEGVTHFFRTDGSLAKSEGVFGAFNPVEHRIYRSLWYDSSGKLLRSKVVYTNFDDKVIKRPDMNSKYVGAAPVKKLSSLPIYRLLFKS